MPRLRQHIRNMPRRQPSDDAANAIDPCNRLVADRIQRWTARRYPAAMHDDKLIGKFCRKVEIVQDGKHETAANSEIPRRFQHRDLVAYIETGRRLVEKESPHLAVFHGMRHLGEARANCTRCCSPPDSML